MCQQQKYCKLKLLLIIIYMTLDFSLASTLFPSIDAKFDFWGPVLKLGGKLPFQCLSIQKLV